MTADHAVAEPVGRSASVRDEAAQVAKRRPDREMDELVEQLGRTQRGAGKRLARGLGWLSIGLGLTEAVVPGWIARFLGIADRRGLLLALGGREIASGIGILTHREPVNWVRARVAGDVMDLALLAAALLSPGTHRGRVAMATAAVAGVTAMDVACVRQLRGSGLVHVRKSVAVNASPEELYGFWRQFGNLACFAKNLVSVEDKGEGRSHWTAKGPGGTTVEWDARIVADKPNEMIVWRSLPGALVDHAGSVRFEPRQIGRGTVVRVEICYRPPGGALGATVAAMFGREPGQQVQEGLRRFKQLIETGEIITTEGQPAGRRRSTSWKYDLAERS